MIKKLLNLFLKKTKKVPIVPKILKIKRNNHLTYIGHSYHKKTGSTMFLKKYLRKYFSLTDIADNSWLGDNFPDLSFIKESDQGVIFFQNLPDIETIKKIKNSNVVFFPMYDSHGGNTKDFWGKYSNLKFINFSQKLHDRMISWGLNSIHVKFFPKPKAFKRTIGLKVFFWQRTDQMDINKLEKIFEHTNVKIHMHIATDPGYSFIQPTKEQEKKYNISYSKWTDDKKEIEKIIQSCNIFVAPRMYEGIGMSYLEAMAMGKAVIAFNNPTMNEYISNNRTGYLIDENKIETIDFSQLEKIQEQTHCYIKNGHSHWQQDKKEIINFIKS